MHPTTRTVMCNPEIMTHCVHAAAACSAQPKQVVPHSNVSPAQSLLSPKAQPMHTHCNTACRAVPGCTKKHAASSRSLESVSGPKLRSLVSTRSTAAPADLSKRNASPCTHPIPYTPETKMKPTSPMSAHHPPTHHKSRPDSRGTLSQASSAAHFHTAIISEQTAAQHKGTSTPIFDNAILMYDDL
jgi:hypothetical protein